MSDEIKELVATQADAEAIKAKAIEQGMLSILEDGFLKSQSRTHNY